MKLHEALTLAQVMMESLEDMGELSKDISCDVSAKDLFDMEVGDSIGELTMTRKAGTLEFIVRFSVDDDEDDVE